MRAAAQRFSVLGLSQSQLFTWQRQTRQEAEVRAEAGSFRTAVMAAEPLAVRA